MRRYGHSWAAILCVAALAGSALAQAPSSPMERLALLVEGNWVSDGGGSGAAVRLEYSWGAGQRSLSVHGRSSGRALAPSLASAEFAYESLCYWHPGEQKYRLLSTSHDGSLSDGWLTLDDRIWDWRVERYDVEGLQSSFITRWVWQGEDAFRATLYEDRAGKVNELSAAEFRRESASETPRPRAGTSRAPKEIHRTLAPLARLADASWEVNESWTDGRVFKNRQVYRWGASRRALWSRTYAIRPLGEDHVYDALYYWHPAEERLRMVVLGAAGDVYEGTVETRGPTTLMLKYDAVGEAPLQLLEQLEFRRDQFQSTLWERSTEVRRKPLLEVTYVRVDDSAEPNGGD